MTDPRDREALVEAAASAWRPRRPNGAIGQHPAWSDLDEVGRMEAYELARVARKLEAALDPDGMSSTARGVMAKIRKRQ